MSVLALDIRGSQIAGNEARQETPVLVERAFNFGFAGRSREEAEKHVEELRVLGLPAPTRIPSIFPVPPVQVTTNRRLILPGLDNYGEAEFALINTGKGGWCVAAASDHSDFLVEGLSTARAKTIYPDVLSTECWTLDDALGHWDELTLIGERRTEKGWEVVQSGHVRDLLRPQEIIAELEERTGEAAEQGTVILSGTIGGEILPGALGWRARLMDPVLKRELVAEYEVESLPAEI